MAIASARERSHEESLAGRAYQAIEEMIVTLRLAPGASVTEPELVALLGLGRTPVREAIQRLAGEGLLMIKPRKGIFVAAVDPYEHLAALETRRVLERIIAPAAARFANAREREDLARCARDMSAAADARDVEAFMREDKTFDLIVGEASRNPFAVRAVRPLQIMSRRFWYAYHGLSDLRVAADLHLAIMKDVEGGHDTEAAARCDALMDHLIETARQIVSGRS